MKPISQKNYLRGLLLGIAALLAFAAPARAKDFTYSATLDLSQLQTVSTGVYQLTLSTPQPSFTLRSGDTLSGTITFGSQALTLNGYPESEFYEELNGGPVSPDLYNVTGTVTLLGLSSNFIGSASLPFGESEDNEILLADDVFQSKDISFTGFSYTIGFSSFATTATFTPSEFDVFDPSGAEVTAAPEPSSMGLICATLVMLVLLRYGFRQGL